MHCKWAYTNAWATYCMFASLLRKASRVKRILSWKIWWRGAKPIAIHVMCLKAYEHPRRFQVPRDIFSLFCWDDQFLNVFQISKQSHLYDTVKWRWMNVLHELHLWIDKDPTGKSKSLIPRVSAAVSAKVCTGWKAFHCQMWRLASVPWPNGLAQLCSMAVSRFCQKDWTKNHSHFANFM